MSDSIQCSFQRYEKKYLLSAEQYEAMLPGMRAYMKADVYGRTTNCSIYYDTDTWELARKSIEKPVYKEKLRVRSYGVPKDGDRVFIELKKKYDGVVYKRRTAMACEHAPGYLAGNLRYSPCTQIGNEIEYFQSRYHAVPKVYLAYDRSSFAGLADPNLRITFDRNIRFRDYALDLRKGDFGTCLLPAERVLMEIKIPGTTPLWLVRLLSAVEARPSSFSKYGTYYKEYIVEQNRKGISYSA